MKRYLLALVLLLVGGAGLNAQTVTVTGHMKSGNTSNVTSKAFMRFRLRNFSGNTPRVTSTGAIVQTQFDVSPDNTGTITTSLYGNDVISPVNTFWTVETWYNGVFQFSYNYGICASTQVTYCSTVGATFNLDSASPISFPTPPAPYLPLPGPTGPTGPQGPIGPQGPPGAGGTGPTLQTNNGTNASQTLLNLLNGSNVTMTNSGGGVTVNAVPGTPNSCLQYNSSSTFASASGICTPDGNSLVTKGPNPIANLAAFTRSVNINGCGTTATINIGTPTTATLASGACFQTNNGLFNDGITIYGAGATISISTPSAPTVTPNTFSSGGTNLGGGNYTPNTVVNGATGSSTYSYILVPFDQFGGFAAPSSATTITNGPSTLGANAVSCAISTESRSGRNVTVNFSSACAGAIAGAMMFVTGTVPNPAGTFGGFYNIQTVNSSSQVVYAGQYDSNSFGWNSTDNGNSGTNSSTGGTAYFITSNHLSWTYGTGIWRYGICAERPGDVSYHRIGITKPSTSQAKDIQFDDYGATMMAGQVYPPYFTDAVCNGASGQNDPLTTTITAGAGTTTVTLANAATNGVSGTTALFDSGPGLIAAANSVVGPWGEVYIPPTASTSGYVINSFTTLPTALKVNQAGKLVLNETLDLPSSIVWSGDSAAQCSAGGLAYYGSPIACIEVNFANPGIYISGNNVTLSNVSFITTGSANWGTQLVDDGNIGKFSNVGFSPDGATDTDFLTEPLILRGGNGTNVCQYELDHLNFNLATFSTTPGSWNPAIFRPYAQNSSGALANGGCTINLSRMSDSGHGIVQEGGGVNWNIDNIYRQGGIMPWLWHLNGAAASPENISFNTVQIDTDGASILSIGNNTGVPVLDIVKGYTINANAGTSFGGFGPSAYDLAYSGITTAPNANGGFVRGCAGTNQTISLNCNFDNNAYIGNNAKIFFPLAPVAAAPTVTTVAGGSFGASVGAEFAIAATGPDGNETFITPLSSSATTDASCPGSGNCSFQITWTGIAGASVYSLYGCGVVGIGGVTCPSTNRAATSVTSPYTLTNAGTIGGGHAANSFTQTGIVGINKSSIWAPEFEFSEIAAPGGVPLYGLLYEDSTTHLPTFNPNNAGAQTAARYTISPTNTDCVNWSGTTGLLGDASGKCGHYTITPTNGDCVTWSGTGGLLGDAGAACGTPGGGMDTNMDNMANPTLMNHSLVPASVNTIAVGTQLLPFTNIFLGTVANQAGSFDTSALTANHVIKFPNADSTAVQNCTSVSHEWISQILQSTGACTQTQPTLADIAAGVAPSGLFDFTSSTMEIPEANGFTATVNSTIGLDTTANAVHFWVNSADSLAATFASAPAGSKCAQTSGTIGQLTEAAAACGTTTPSTTDTFTNKTYNAESTGNALSEPVRAYFGAGGCNNSTASNGFDIGVTNAPTPQCAGSTVRKGVLQFARGNVAYLNFHLPKDWNSGASVDLEMCFTTVDTTNGHVTSFNIQTGFNKTDGTVTDDPSLNSSQALSVTTGASQTAGGELCGLLTGLTTTGAAADYNAEIAITRNNSGTDTNSDTAVAVKNAQLVFGVTKNSTNR